MAKRPLDEESKKQLQNVGKRLKQLRIEKGFTNYEQFAYENDIPRAQYGRYERGEDLKLSSLLRVLKGLNISITDFFADGFD